MEKSTYDVETLKKAFIAKDNVFKRTYANSIRFNDVDNDRKCLLATVVEK